MAGNVEGGRQAAITNRERYGLNFYKKIGERGGKARKRPGGFAVNHELAVAAGKKGGKASRRTTGTRV